MSPEEALQSYRQISSPEITRQATLFTGLSTDEKLELLFYISCHQGKAVMEACDQLGICLGKLETENYSN